LQKRSNRNALRFEDLSARHSPTHDPANRRRNPVLKPLGGWLTLARASQVATAIARQRSKTRGLNAVTLDNEFEPGPQYGSYLGLNAIAIRF
jgi:hypothetical protein